MSKKSWLERLQKTLSRLRHRNSSFRIAILGIGHEKCGDDAVGMIIVQAIQSLRFESDRVLEICAGVAPENFAGTPMTFLARSCHPNRCCRYARKNWHGSLVSLECLKWPERLNPYSAVAYLSYLSHTGVVLHSCVVGNSARNSFA